MKPKIIGFASLLEKCGKSDFFGITYINAKHAEIPDKLFKLIDEKNNKISIQIYILAGVLKCFYDRDIDLFKENSILI